MSFKDKVKRMLKIGDDFKQPQPLTNGNLYSVYKTLEAQEQLDFATIDTFNKTIAKNVVDLHSLTHSIKEIGDKIIREKNIDEYFLLQYLADYYVGTCRFETKDTYFFRMIINVVRGAFFMGTAGIYKNDKLGIYQPVYITQMEYGIDAKLKKCKILPLSTCIQRMNETQLMVEDKDLKGFVELREKEVENLAIFSWGSMGYSCWINKYPFVKLQHLMLTIIIINAFVFNKKWIYKLNNFSSIRDEIELFFNPANPFIVNVGNLEDLSNRFSTEDIGSGSNTSDVIDYYNKMLGVYFQIMGRKINSDYKKERNISDEVEATQENIDDVQSDYLNQFKIFLMECKKLGIQVEYKEQEKEKEKKENDDTNKGKRDNGGE